MKPIVIYLTVLVGCLGLAVYAKRSSAPTPCWCWSYGQGMVVTKVPHPKGTEYNSYGSYGSEADWSNPDHIIPLNYDQAEGKRVFYQQCIWCHADATPAGPSNRTNVTPTPPLMNDGDTFNAMSDASLQRIIALGGRAVGKSSMMPPYDKSLTPEEIQDVILYTRVIATPAYHRPSLWKRIAWKQQK